MQMTSGRVLEDVHQSQNAPFKWFDMSFEKSVVRYGYGMQSVAK